MVDAVGGSGGFGGEFDEVGDNVSKVARPGGAAALVVDYFEFVFFGHEAEHGVDEVVAVAAVEPGGADDPGTRVCRKGFGFAVAFGASVDAGRVGRVVLAVGAAAVAVEDVVGGNVEEFGADVGGQACDVRRTCNVKFGAEFGVVFGFVDGGVGGAVDDCRYRCGGGKGVRKGLEGCGVGYVDFAVGADEGEVALAEGFRQLGAEHAFIADEPDHGCFPVSFFRIDRARYSFISVWRGTG